METTVIISRSSDGDSLKTSLEDALARLCADEAGVNVLVTPHIYHIPEAGELWEELTAVRGKLIFVTWIHPRPTTLILTRHSLAATSAFNLETYPIAEECLAALIQAGMESSGGTGTIREISAEVSARWYPELDFSACTNCGACLQFCLFNVYSYDDSGVVMVANPDNCKPGCPACSRICPEKAIVFPLFAQDPSIAGAPEVFNLEPSIIDIPAQPSPHLTREALDDIDLLINDLENLARGRNL